MSDLLEVFAGVVLLIATYAVYLGVLFAFIWAVWNYIIVPTVPVILGAI